METADLNEAFSSQRTAAYNSYASQCYPTARVEQSESCRPYVKPKLSYTITRNATCPFDDEICRLKSDNLILDSGQLDSHDDFGLNSPKGKRFSFRVKSQCAPLVTEGFSKIHTPEDEQYTQSVQYYYGKALGVISTKDSSFTYQVPYNISSRSVANYTSMQVPNPDYVIGLVYSRAFVNKQLILQEQHYRRAVLRAYQATQPDRWRQSASVSQRSGVTLRRTIRRSLVFSQHG